MLPLVLLSIFSQSIPPYIIVSVKLTTGHPIPEADREKCVFKVVIRRDIPCLQPPGFFLAQIMAPPLRFFVYPIHYHQPAHGQDKYRAQWSRNPSQVPGLAQRARHA